MKSLLTAGMIVVVASQFAFGGLKWGTDASVIFDFDGNPVATSTDYTPTAGAFAQLIRILIGTTPFAFVNSGSGISVGNEEVIRTTYSGQNDDLSDPGTFVFSGSYDLTDISFNGTYYVRVFDVPQATSGAWDLGVAAPIPVGAQYYYQSSTLTYAHNELNNVDWDFTLGSGGQTLSVVPEPGTLALFGLGVLGLAVRRRMNV